VTVETLTAESAPRVLHRGERLLSARLPAGTRVVYPPAPLPGLPDVDGAIDAALDHPLGMDPFDALLRPGMKVTIAIDDVSLPLPRMAAPDVRARILSRLLERLAHARVDDVHVIVATGLHRRVKPRELRHLVGARVFAALPASRLYNHDAEDPDGIVGLGTTSEGDPVELNRRAAESDLLVYANVSWVPMNGGHKSVGVGLASYRTIARHHEPETLVATPSYMAPESSRLHARMDHIGRFVEGHLKVFHVETTLNNRMFGPGLGFLAACEDSLGASSRAALAAMRLGLAAAPSGLRRRLLEQVPAAYEVTGVWAGAAEPVHAEALRRCFEQYTVRVEGQADILVTGVPYVSPYSIGAPMNPLLVQLMALGYLFNMHRGTPPLRQGGTLVVCHDLAPGFDPEQHASYAEFFDRVLTATRDAHEMHRVHEPAFARDPRWVRAYRFGHAYHGAHPFYMWYWGERGRRWVGRVICAGTRNAAAAARLGWEHAPTLEAALDLARDGAPTQPRVTVLHHPPALIADVRV
jgi:hypothetical protein